MLGVERLEAVQFKPASSLRIKFQKPTARSEAIDAGPPLPLLAKIFTSSALYLDDS